MSFRDWNFISSLSIWYSQDIKTLGRGYEVQLYFSEFVSWKNCQIIYYLWNILHVYVISSKYPNISFETCMLWKLYILHMKIYKGSQETWFIQKRTSYWSEMEHHEIQQWLLPYSLYQNVVCIPQNFYCVLFVYAVAGFIARNWWHCACSTRKLMQSSVFKTSCRMTLLTAYH